VYKNEEKKTISDPFFVCFYGLLLVLMIKILPQKIFLKNTATYTQKQQD